MRGPSFFAKAAGHQAQTLQIRCMFLQTPYGVMKHSEPNRPYSQITEDCDGSTFRRQIPRGRCDERAYRWPANVAAADPLVKEGQ